MQMLLQKAQHVNLPLATANSQAAGTWHPDLPSLRVHITRAYFVLRTSKRQGFNLSRWQRVWGSRRMDKLTMVDAYQEILPSWQKQHLDVWEQLLIHGMLWLFICFLLAPALCISLGNTSSPTPTYTLWSCVAAAVTLQTVFPQNHCWVVPLGSAKERP